MSSDLSSIFSKKGNCSKVSGEATETSLPFFRHRQWQYSLLLLWSSSHNFFKYSSRSCTSCFWKRTTCRSTRKGNRWSTSTVSKWEADQWASFCSRLEGGNRLVGTLPICHLAQPQFHEWASLGFLYNFDHWWWQVYMHNYNSLNLKSTLHWIDRADYKRSINSLSLIWVNSFCSHEPPAEQIWQYMQLLLWSSTYT